MAGDTQAAEKQLDKALQSAKDDIQTWILKGELELSLRKPERAQASFEKALELSPSSATARMGIVRAMLAQGKADEAAGHIDALAKGSPNHPLVNYLKRPRQGEPQPPAGELSESPGSQTKQRP
jgi:predicted Zn-dependent protease